MSTEITPTLSVAVYVIGCIVPPVHDSPPFGDVTVTVGGVTSAPVVGVRYGETSPTTGMFRAEPRLLSLRPGNVGVLEYVPVWTTSALLLRPSPSESSFSMAGMAAAGDP